MAHVPVSPGAKEMVPDGFVLLAIEHTLAVGDVRPVLAAVQALGVWKLGIVTAGPDTHESWFMLIRYLSRNGASEPTLPCLELLVDDPVGPAAVRLGEQEWRDVYRFLDSDIGRAFRLPPLPERLVVDDRLSWAAFVQVHDALWGAEPSYLGLPPNR